VIGNRTRIEQVLANLVRNALDAASAGRQGSRRVTLSAKRTRAAVQLRVTDTGPGVRADVQASLFTPYVTTKPDGTGLGLSLSRSIIEAHGGRLVLERTTPGRTTFLAELPRASARQQP
jgi:signal transduction histidine kinase